MENLEAAADRIKDELQHDQSRLIGATGVGGKGTSTPNHTMSLLYTC